MSGVGRVRGQRVKAAGCFDFARPIPPRGSAARTRGRLAGAALDRHQNGTGTARVPFRQPGEKASKAWPRANATAEREERRNARATPRVSDRCSPGTRCSGPGPRLIDPAICSSPGRPSTAGGGDVINKTGGIRDAILCLDESSFCPTLL